MSAHPDLRPNVKITQEDITVDGMSSDDAAGEVIGTDGKKRKLFKVRQMRWRASEAKAYWRTIEQLAPILLGRDPRGGKLGVRVDDFTKFSTRPARRGAPINYYDEKWYKGLSDLEQRLLKPKPRMNLTLPDWVQK